MRRNFKTTDCLILVVLMLVIGSSFNGCSESPFVPKNQGPLVGAWDWRQSCGGFAGQCFYADSVDYTRTISFTNDYDFIEMRNDSIVFSSTYEVVRKPFWGGIDTSDVLVIEGYWIEMKIEQLRNDSLLLVDRCFDCFGHLYTKLGDI